MKSPYVDYALQSCRSMLALELLQVLNKCDGQSITLNDLPIVNSSTDFSGYNVIQKVYLGKDSIIHVSYYDKETEKHYDDPIHLFTIDEIVEIIDNI